MNTQTEHYLGNRIYAIVTEQDGDIVVRGVTYRRKDNVRIVVELTAQERALAIAYAQREG